MSILSEHRKAAFLATSMVRGESVTIADPDSSWTVSVTAVRGRSTHIKEDRQGVKIRSYSVDFVVDAAVLVDSSGTVLEPQRNWTVTTATGAVFRLLPFGADDDVWRWSGNTETHRRLFTKQKS